MRKKLYSARDVIHTTQTSSAGLEVRRAKHFTNAQIAGSRSIILSVTKRLILRMNWQDHITSNPEIMFGKPCIKGTRIPVDAIVEKLSNGDTIEYLLTAYPNITREHISACLKYAAESIRNETFYAA